MELKVNSIYFYFNVLFLKLSLTFSFLAPQAPSIKGVSSDENNVVFFLASTVVCQ